MPFTFSHPAIILPLAYVPRQWRSLTGLVIGSLTPDFEYFLRMQLHSRYSHTLNGLLWFDLPLGILLAFIFHNLVRDHLINNLPHVLQSRFSRYTRYDWNAYFKAHWFIVSISILIGAASHLLWDGFTHESGYFVHMLPFLRDKLQLWGTQVPLLKALQHSSTLIGGLAIILAVWKMPVDSSVKSGMSMRYWGLWTSLTLLMIAVRFALGLDYKLYGDVIVTSISSGIIALIVTPILMNLKNDAIARKGSE